jgi:hypothetical protein
MGRRASTSHTRLDRQDRGPHQGHRRIVSRPDAGTLSRLTDTAAARLRAAHALPISFFAKPEGLVIRERGYWPSFPGSSVVEQPAVNRLVAGSNPARGATFQALPVQKIEFGATPGLQLPGATGGRALPLGNGALCQKTSPVRAPSRRCVRRARGYPIARRHVRSVWRVAQPSWPAPPAQALPPGSPGRSPAGRPAGHRPVIAPRLGR